MVIKVKQQTNANGWVNVLQINVLHIDLYLISYTLGRVQNYFNYAFNDDKYTFIIFTIRANE